jgi:glycosyltransferase involved in cell wall biosynthesis
MIEKMPWLRPLRRFFDWCEARAIKGALATAPVCNALADLARSRSAKHVTTLHDISQLDPASLVVKESIRDRLGLTGTILMYVGNLETYQGIDLLMEAFPLALAQRPEIDLVVAGGTPIDIERYRAKAQRLGVGNHVHFIGPWPVERLGELLVQADILTAPRTKGINTPMKVFPYLHTGRAVLVTDLPTHTQVLDRTVCELAPAEPQGFAAAIVSLADDPERRLELGEAGRKFAEEEHTYPAHERRVKKLYDHVAEVLGLTPSIHDSQSNSKTGNRPEQFV